MAKQTIIDRDMKKLTKTYQAQPYCSPIRNYYVMAYNLLVEASIHLDETIEEHLHDKNAPSWSHEFQDAIRAESKKINSAVLFFKKEISKNPYAS